MESFPFFCSTSACQALEKQIMSGSNGATIALSLSNTNLLDEYRAPDFVAEGCVVFVALGTHREIGSAVVPFQRDQEGSTVFLPFKSDLLVVAVVKDGKLDCYQRKW